jgi:hypothetical protein
MDEVSALDVLREHHLPASSVREIVGGWAFWTFDVDGEWIAAVSTDRSNRYGRRTRACPAPGAGGSAIVSRAAADPQRSVE